MKPVFYRKYVDDIFVLFESAKHPSKFCDYFNTCHPNMSSPLNKTKIENCYFLIKKYQEKWKFFYKKMFIESLLLVVCTSSLKVSSQPDTNFAWFMHWPIVVVLFCFCFFWMLDVSGTASYEIIGSSVTKFPQNWIIHFLWYCTW